VGWGSVHVRSRIPCPGHWQRGPGIVTARRDSRIGPGPQAVTDSLEVASAGTGLSTLLRCRATLTESDGKLADPTVPDRHFRVGIMIMITVTATAGESMSIIYRCHAGGGG
jgi:hypothetical protein